MIIDYQLWDEVGKELQDNKYKKRYLTPEQYDKLPNPLENLVVPVGIDSFFGTKVCNIFIVAIPFGWKSSTEEEWPPPGYEDAKQRHKDTYDKFAKYETHVYMDFNIVKKIMAEEPESKFEEMMQTTKAHMQSMCADLSEYGFKMEGDITGDVTASHFYEVIDAFYKV